MEHHADSPNWESRQYRDNKLRPVARLVLCVCGGRGQIGQILGPFMIMCGLSCDRVGFGHFGGGADGYGPVSCLGQGGLHSLSALVFKYNKVKVITITQLSFSFHQFLWLSMHSVCSFRCSLVFELSLSDTMSCLLHIFMVILSCGHITQFQVANWFIHSVTGIIHRLHCTGLLSHTRYM